MPCVTLTRLQWPVSRVSPTHPSMVHWGFCGRVFKVCASIALVTAQPTSSASPMTLRGHLICSCLRLHSVQPIVPVLSYQRVVRYLCVCMMIHAPHQHRYLLHTVYVMDDRSAKGPSPNMNVVYHHLIVVNRGLSPLTLLSFSPRLSPRQFYISYCLREREGLLVSIESVNSPSVNIITAARTFMSEGGPVYLYQSRHVVLRDCSCLVYTRGLYLGNRCKSHILLSLILPLLPYEHVPQWMMYRVWVGNLACSPVLSTMHLSYVVRHLTSLPSVMCYKDKYRSGIPPNRYPCGGVQSGRDMRAVWARLTTGGIQLVPWTVAAPTVTNLDTGDTKIIVVILRRQIW